MSWYFSKFIHANCSLCTHHSPSSHPHTPTHTHPHTHPHTTVGYVVCGTTTCFPPSRPFSSPPVPMVASTLTLTQWTITMTTITMVTITAVTMTPLANLWPSSPRRSSNPHAPWTLSVSLRSHKCVLLVCQWCRPIPRPHGRMGCGRPRPLILS